jgi:serine/threonine-protein kinase
MGSPKYMAPEQIRGDRVDARTDIYSLGVMMYEMLSGKVPFDRPNSVNTLMAHVNELPPPLRTTNPNILLGAPMEDVVMKCIEKDPDLRFKSMDELLAALKRVMGVGGSVFPAGATGNFQALSAVASGSYPGPTQSVTPSPLRSVPPAPLITVTPPPGSRADLVTPSEVPPRRSRTMLALLVTGLAIGIGISAFVLGPRTLGAKKPDDTTSAGRPPELPTPTPTPSNVAVAVTATASAAGAVPSKTASVHVKTEPEGAVVREDGREVCAATPCDIPYTGDEAVAAHHLVVSKAGFRSELRETKAGGDPLTVHLVRVPQTVTAPRPTDSTTPQGFKEIPY